MTPPISTDACTASVNSLNTASASNATSSALLSSTNMQPSSLTSLFMEDIDPYILRDFHSNDLLNSNFNGFHHHFNDGNNNDGDLFSFDKMNSTFASTGLFDINHYGDSMMHFNNNYSSFNINNNNGSNNNHASLHGNGSNIINLMNFNTNEDDDDDDEEDDDDDDLEKCNVNHDDDDDSDNLNNDDDFLANLEDHDINENLLFGSDTFGINNATTNDTVAAIREMAIRDERQHQQLQHQIQAKQNRKHKNSTSSVSSVSMTSTIKKVAIELQNSTANLVSNSSSNNIFNYNLKQGSNVKSVPINYDLNNFILNTNANNNVEINELKPDLVDNFIDDENDFEDLLGLDDWEQMLDEDCISRLTADFNFTSNCNNKSLVVPANTTNTTTQPTPAITSTTTHQVNLNSSLATPSKLQQSKPNQPLVLVLSSNSSSSSSSSPSSLSSSSLSSPNYSHQHSLVKQPNKTPITQITKLVSTTPQQTPSKILTTTKTTDTSSVVKKLNSVIINETRCMLPSNNSNTTTTITLDASNRLNNAGSNKNIILKNKTNNQQQTAVITATTGITQTVSNGSLVSAKAKTLTKPLTGSMITATAQTISIIKSPIKKPLVLSSPSLTNTTPVVSATTTNSTNNTNSLIDFNDIIDCVNPDQIFPYRLPLLRFIKSELDEQINNDDSGDLRNDKTRKLLSYEEDEEEDDEEIDVVSVNYQNNHMYGSTNNTSINNEHTLLNSNHHNYFHSANKNVKSTSNNSKQQQQKNQVVLLKNLNNENDLFANNRGNNSLLANYLKSSPITKTNNSLGVSNTGNTNPPVTKTISKQTSISQQQIITNENNVKKQNSNNFIKTTKLNNNSNNINTSVTTTPVMNKPQQFQRKSQMTTGKKANTNIANKQSGQQQVNSIRILATNTNNTKTETGSVAITKLNSPTVNLNKDILLQQQQQLNGTTKFITMTSTSKLAASSTNNTNVKCQAITPTTNKSVMATNVPKIITTSNNNYLKLNNFNLNSNSSNNVNNNANLTAIKLATSSNNNASNTSLNKLNTNIRKVNKIKSPIQNDNFDDEPYYEDEDFNRRLNVNSTNNVMLKQKNKLKEDQKPINDNGIDYDQQFNYEYEDDLDDDDEDLDDIEDDECSSSSSSSSPSPGSSSSLLTSSGTSSGYSTPTKSKASKADHKNNANNESSFDLNVLNEKLNKKQNNNKKKNMQTAPSSVSSSSSSSLSTGQQLLSTSSKRNSRLSSMGYSSDNPAEKRAFHILSERQRRNDLKKLFETLRINIPALCDKQKASKLTILKAAVDHLAEVTNKKEKLCSIFDKEKLKHSKLMQQLKNLQQQHQFNNYSSSISNGQQSLTTLVVH